MLTKDDLSEIRKLIRKETRQIVREEIEAESGNTNEEIGASLRELKIDLARRIYSVESRVKNSDIKIRKEIKKLGRKVDKMDNFLDKEIMSDRRRIVKIEEHLGLPSPQTI